MFVLAAIVLASYHEVEKAGHVDLHFLFVGEPALLRGELALAHRVVDARLLSKVVRKTALVALGTIVLVVELPADVFGGLGLDDLSLDGVGEEAVEAVLAVAHVEVDAGVEAAFNVHFLALGGSLAFVDREVLVGAQVLDLVQLSF